MNYIKAMKTNTLSFAFIISVALSISFFISCTQSSTALEDFTPPDPIGKWHTVDWSIASIPVTLEFELLTDKSLSVLGIVAGDTGTIRGTWSLTEDETRIDSIHNAMKLVALVDSCVSQNPLVEQLICHEDTLSLPFLEFQKDSLWKTVFLEYELELVPKK